MKTIYTIIFFLTLGVNVFSQQSQCGCYTEYVAVLNQTGAEAPEATVLKNNTGYDIQWLYDAPGVYYTTDITGIDANKVVVFGGDGANHMILINASWNGVNVSLTSHALNSFFDPVQSDDLIQFYPIFIRIYQ